MEPAHPQWYRRPVGRGVGIRVHRDDRCDGEPEQQPEPEQEADRELLTAPRSRVAEPENEPECGDEQEQPGPAAQIAAEVGAELVNPTVTAT